MPSDKDVRSLFSLKADEIEDAFHKSDKDPQFVQEVIIELGRRKTMRARTLLDFVKRAVGAVRNQPFDSVNVPALSSPTSFCERGEEESPLVEEPELAATLDTTEVFGVPQQELEPTQSMEFAETFTGAEIEATPHSAAAVEGGPSSEPSLMAPDLSPLEGLDEGEVATGIYDQSIEMLIKASTVGTRLSNCSDDKYFRSTTLRWALENRLEFEKACIKVPNFGRTTLTELLRLVDAFAEKGATEGADFSGGIEARFVSGELPQAQPETTTLSELVISSDASVRLTNCISRSHLAGMTVAAAISDPANLEVECRRISGMGRTSIRELQDILAQAFPAQSLKQTAGESSVLNPASLSSLLLKALAKLFSDITLEQICGFVGTPVRVANGIEASEFRDRPLGELFLDWPQIRREMTRQKNLGRTSLEDLTMICSDLIVRFLQTAYVAEDASKAAADFLLNRTPISDELSADLIGTLQGIANFKVSDLAVSEIVPLHEMAEQLLSGLKARPREVIERRYGIGRDQAETLEQIGADHKVTRERIRQIEKKALGALSVTAKLLPIEECLVAFGDKAWTSLGGKKGYLSKNDIKNVRGLPAEFIFLSDVAGVTLEGWLDNYGRRWEGGWCSKAIDIAELNAIASSIEDELKGKPLPRPCPRLGSLSEADLTAVVVELKLGKRLYGGYILEAERGTLLVRRAVELHSMFGVDARPIDAAELVFKLSAKLGSASISIRYIAEIMSRYPHLFLEGDDAAWFGLAAQAYSDAVIERKPQPSFVADVDDVDDVDDVEGDAFTMAGFLKGILERTGPMKLSDIVAEAQKTLPSDRSIASVGPTILTHREAFVRALPGLYCLPQAIPSDGELALRPPAYLANEEQARLYAFGRKAGEPWGTFPLWSPAAEAVLCSWARQNADASILQSLLSVATFDAWPVDADARRTWKDFTTKCSPRFLLHFQPREGIGYALPKLDRLLAACLEAQASDQFNWMVGNRILKRPVYSHMSAGLMALMCSLDVLKLEQDGHWQLPHSCSSNLGHVIQLLSIELHERGVLEWDSAIGACILAQAGEMIGRWSGWVDKQLLAAMLSSPSAGEGHGVTDFNDFIGKAVEAEIKDLQWVAEEGVFKPTQPQDDRSLSGYSALQVTSIRVLTDEEGEWSFEDNPTD